VRFSDADLDQTRAFADDEVRLAARDELPVAAKSASKTA
jgi:hypothetical protein